MTPYKCPVCGGRGKVPNGFYNTSPYYSSSSLSDEICRSCSGSGILWSKDEKYGKMPTTLQDLNNSTSKITFPNSACMNH